MRDVTFCTSLDCPSKDCKIRITNNKFEPHEIISMADFSGVCRYYIGWLLIHEEEKASQSISKGKKRGV